MTKLKILDSKLVYDHPWERIYIEKVETDEGKQFDYLISEPNDFVIIIPFIKKDRLLMVKQYKHGAQEELLGFPAGFISKDETPLDAARRELDEEVGLHSNSLQVVATLSENPTRCRNHYYIVTARACTRLHNRKNIDEKEGDIEKVEVLISDLRSPEVLKNIKAGSMLSALPFII